MKKFLSSALSLVIVLSMSTSAFATNITTNGGTNNTLVTYGMSQGFRVTIPADFEIDTQTKKAEANVSASDVMISHWDTLEVTVSGHDYDDKWELIDADEATNKLTYIIGSTDGASDIINDSVVLSVNAGTAWDTTVTEKMYFTVTDEVTKAGNYSDTLTFTVGLTDGSEPIIIMETFADSTWSGIIAAVQNNEVPATWNIGDIKTMEINSQEYEVQIIGKNHDTYSDDSGIAPLTFQLVSGYDILIMDRGFENIAGWSGSSLRKNSLPRALQAMPREVQKAIKPVNKETIKGDKSGLEITSDKLFLLSEKEVFNTTGYPDKNAEGTQYAFYANGGSTIKESNGRIWEWWLRSPYYFNNYHFKSVYTDGKLGNTYANGTNGVPFAFCF